MTGAEERLSDLLNDTLHERVDHRDLPSTPMGDVVTRARRLQRRRRIRNGVVAAAVVAVLATPFVIDATNRPSTGPEPADPSSTEPAPRVRLADVALGDPPAVPWLDGSDYVAADGTRTTLPVSDLMDATPYRGGFLAASYGNGRITLFDGRLQPVWQRCGVPVFAVSHGGTRTAYAAGDCRTQQTTLHLGPTDGAGGELTQTMPLDRATPFGIVGDAVVTSSYNEGPAQLVEFDGRPVDIEQLREAHDVEERSGLVTGQLAGGIRERSTGAVVELATGAVRWSVLGWNLQAFSPDGSMVVGVRLSAPTESAGVGVFDTATGEPLHEFAMPTDFRFNQVAWEDDAHLLLATTQGRTQALLRSTLDGAIQRATEAAAYDPNGTVGYAFHLAPDPRS
jgi:hypothetical protein